MRAGVLSLASRAVRLAAPPPGLAVAILGLSLAAAALEALALALFMPLVRALGGEAVTGPAGELLRHLGASPGVGALAATLFGAILGKNLVGFLGGYAARRVDGLVAHRLRVRALGQTLAACPDLQPDGRATDIVATLANNTWKVSEALSLVWRLVICGCTALVFTALLLALSPALAGVSVLAIGATAAVVHLATRKAESFGRAVVEENRAFGLRMWETITALPLVRAFGREDFELQRFAAASERVRRRILRLDILWSTPGPIAEIMAALLIAVLIVAGRRLGVGLGALAAFLAVLYRLQGPVREWLACKVALDGLAPAIDDVRAFFRATAAPLVTSGRLPAPPLCTALELRAVAFRYAGGEPLALKGVDLHIPAGRTTAVVGRSGAGKSTLMSLLLRLRDPTSGAILADGAPLTDLDLAAWRSRISLMPQDAQLFHASVAENIAYGDLNASAEQIREAARIAGAHEFIIQLPQGYDTLVGDRGARLSGGQRQRVALARTILRDPALLLLDEPTNALDPETERAFQTALETFAAGRTVVVIAHRLSTVMAADQVVVLEEGRVAEVGPPDQLIARPGLFARLHGLDVGQPAEAA